MTTGPERDDEFDVLPDITSDEQHRGWGDPEDADDDRLLAERPPHWS
ncbi:hypothetical protein CLV30_10557 [Haloactinopolyspora alba]|uniref:Uncharacterized protein n=1 Tax=Haloactinopolyspora alba TaxID=648780 RepID=A0A2P8E552_9ACTN|nr:hypothetical protein [Haloactinopolyspora alba]PSL04593.1 hypothetical protein CLV30_10557 [Haloactinopolyspora alba]